MAEGAEQGDTSDSFDDTVDAGDPGRGAGTADSGTRSEAVPQRARRRGVTLAAAGVTLVALGVAAVVGISDSAGSGDSSRHTAVAYATNRPLDPGAVTQSAVDGQPAETGNGPAPSGTVSGTAGATTGGAPAPGGVTDATPGGTQPNAGGIGQPNPGGTTGGPGPVPPSGPGPSSTPGAPRVLFDGIAGPGCTGPGAGYFKPLGSGSGSGWSTESSGGWRGDGCNGTMMSMPMTGQAGKNTDNRGLWRFTTGTLTNASCTVSVYIPWDGKSTDTGGDQATYQFFDTGTDTNVSGAVWNQNTAHSRWLTAPPFRITGTGVGVRLLDQGVDYPYGYRYGISAVRLHCTS